MNLPELLSKYMHLQGFGSNYQQSNYRHSNYLRSNYRQGHITDNHITDNQITIIDNQITNKKKINNEIFFFKKLYYNFCNLIYIKK